jgi:ABC-type nitrate/sulfonate/bicarbonate transport system permease component
MATIEAIRAATGPVTRRPRRGAGWWSLRLLMTFGLLVVLLAAWQVAASIAPSPFIPSPATIGATFWKLFVAGGASLSPSSAWLQQALPTIGRALLGFVLACVSGVLIGTLIGLSRIVRYSTSWVVDFIRAIPASAMLPLFILVLGGSDAMRVAFITYTISLYALINTANGVGSVDPALLMTGRVFRLSRVAIVFRIVLPAASPQIFAAVRIATNGSTIVAIVSEFFVASNGIGYQIRYTSSIFDYPGMWAWILLLSLYGLALNLIVEAVGRRLLSWHWRS